MRNDEGKERVVAECGQLRVGALEGSQYGRKTKKKMHLLCPSWPNIFHPP
jgi:hypothetical protein